MLSDLVLRLEKRKQQGNLRGLICPTGLIDFASNDYLGLAKSASFAAEAQKEWMAHTTHSYVGSTGSRLLTGNSAYVEKLEAEIAAFHGFESGLIFNSGFTGNLGLLSAIANANDLILYDSHIHASTRLGIKLSAATSMPFRHNDVNDLEQRIRKRKNKGSCYLCIESIYSTDGSMAPIEEIITLCRQRSIRLIVDEAHSVGVLGPQGRGVAALFARQTDLFCLIVTFGKALGAMGAIVMGSHTLRDNLINFSYPYIYTTALPLPLLAAISTSYKVFPHRETERIYLKKLIYSFRNHFQTTSETAIQSFSVKGAKEAKHLAKLCQDSGFDVRALTSPTVRKGEEMLRIVLHAFNHESEIHQLRELLQ